MELRQFVRTLVEMIWEREQRTRRSVDAVVLGYVQDAVTAQLEYRRRMEDLDRRIVGIVAPTGASGDQ